MENTKKEAVTKVFSAYLDAELPLPFEGRQVLSDGRTIFLLPHKAFVWVYRTLLADTQDKNGEMKGYDVKVSYEDLTEGYRYPVIRCHITDKYGHEGNRIGSAHPRSLTTEIARMYPPEMAEKRAFDRAMADYLGLEDILSEEAYVPVAGETEPQEAEPEETQAAAASPESAQTDTPDKAEGPESEPDKAEPEKDPVKKPEPDPEPVETKAETAADEAHEPAEDATAARPEEKPDAPAFAQAEPRVAEAPFDPVIPDDPVAEPEDPAEMLPDTENEDMPDDAPAEEPAEAAPETEPAPDPAADKAPADDAKADAVKMYGSVYVVYGQYAREFHGKATIADMFRIDAERQKKDPDYPAMADFFLMKYNPSPDGADYEKKVAFKAAVQAYAKAVGYVPKLKAEK